MCLYIAECTQILSFPDYVCMKFFISFFFLSKLLNCSDTLDTLCVLAHCVYTPTILSVSNTFETEQELYELSLVECDHLYFNILSFLSLSYGSSTAFSNPSSSQIAIYCFLFKFTVLSLPLNPFKHELNPIRHLLTLAGAHHFVHVSRIRINVIR
jgi:hypothetical protein